jgi:hypothetical protein
MRRRKRRACDEQVPDFDLNVVPGEPTGDTAVAVPVSASPQQVFDFNLNALPGEATSVPALALLAAVCAENDATQNSISDPPPPSTLPSEDPSGRLTDPPPRKKQLLELWKESKSPNPTYLSSEKDTPTSLACQRSLRLRMTRVKKCSASTSQSPDPTFTPSEKDTPTSPACKRTSRRKTRSKKCSPPTRAVRQKKYKGVSLYPRTSRYEAHIW